MKILDWLEQGDWVIKYLVLKYLKNESMENEDKGYIERYLSLFDKETDLWGGSLYSNKWISSTYTLLELKYMEISWDNPVFQMGVQKVLDGMWTNGGRVSERRMQDMCMTAMFINLACYAESRSPKIIEMADYMLSHVMKDGGWNCSWDSYTGKSEVSSVHTTISVLEGFAEYLKQGYGYRRNDIAVAMRSGEEFLLKRDLFKNHKTGAPIKEEMVKFHYPHRWKYDCFRALEYFAREDRPFDPRMTEALEMIKSMISKGFINKGTTYSGKIHFPLETGKRGRFNTFRALLILKKYDFEFYNMIVDKEYDYTE